MNVTALIPAAGRGTRMKDTVGKPFLPLRGRPILAHTLDSFEKCSAVDGIILVVAPEMVDRCSAEITSAFGYTKVKRIVPGGERRQDSVHNGLLAIRDRCDIVLIHDGVRPLVTVETIERSIVLCQQYGAVITAVPPKETIKRGEGGFVFSTLDRTKLWTVQTPQTFTYDLILKAYTRAYEDRFWGTDDASLVERLGASIKILEGSYDNIKITTQDDLCAAESLFQRRSG